MSPYNQKTLNSPSIATCAANNCSGGLNVESIGDVKVEWKNEFSEYVTQKMELLKHSDSKSK